MAKRLTEPHIGVTVMLTNQLIDRLEAYRQRMQDELPGLNVSKSDAARLLLSRGLDEEEDE